MRTWIALAVGLLTASTMMACGSKAGTLQGSADALGAADTRTIEYSGTGKWYQFGQAPNPTLPWPAFDVSAFTASINYETPAARIQMTRKQVIEGLQSHGHPAFFLNGSAGTEFLTTGQAMNLQVDLHPGEYALMCFFPDPKTGMPHAFMGMVNIVHLK